MFAIDRLLLAVGLMLIVAVSSSRFAWRLGMPALVIFLAVGMLAGSEGLGGIAFVDYELAHGIGTLALAVILFDGGLQTTLSSFRMALRPALVLATIGVVLTSAITGFVAVWLLDVSPLEGVLLGSIVGSTDAAAVFLVLRGQGLRLPDRLASTLEVESGSNDPMAIFLTVAVLEVLVGRREPGLGLLGFFAVQMSVGAATGIVIGWLAAELNNRFALTSAALYPVRMAAQALLAYGAAAALGGSGFLSVYLAGIVLGNRKLVARAAIVRFMDGMAWLAQIAMFVMLGLLSFPSQLLEAAPAGLLIALALMVVARPVTVVGLLIPFGFNAREILFLSWAGLKGAVPIILAIYPLIYGLASGPAIFNVVFFAVLVSALAQGWSLPALARRLGLDSPASSEPPVALEITSLRDVDGEIVEFLVRPGSRAAGRMVRDLALPAGAVVAMITRGEDIIPPRGSTEVRAGDHVFLVLRSAVRPLVDRVFGQRASGGEEHLPSGEFPLTGATTLGDLEEFYGFALAGPPEMTLDAFLRQRLGNTHAVPGTRVAVDQVALVVREVRHGAIDLVGLEILPPDGSRRANPS